MVYNSLQALVQAITCVLLLYLAYTFIVSKEEHGRLFGLGLVFLGLSFASWGANTMLWTNQFVEYKSLAYGLQLASILVFLGCGIYLVKPKYQKILNYSLIGISVLLGLFLLINPYLSGPFIYSLRYYFSFADASTVGIYAIVMAVSLILAAIAVSPKRNLASRYLSAVKVGFIILAISLAISLTSYDDTIRSINAILLLSSLTYLVISHSKTLLSKK